MLIKPENGTETEQIPKLASFISIMDSPISSSSVDSDVLENIDLSVVPFIKTDIPLFLERNPAFYPGSDFRTILEKKYKNISTGAQKEDVHGTEINEMYPQRWLRHVEYIEIMLKENFSVDAVLLEGNDAGHTSSIDSLEEFIALITSLASSELTQLAPDFRLVRLAYDIASGLAMRGTIVPAIYGLGQDSFIIHWEPFINIPEVKNSIALLQRSLRPDFISVKTSDKKLASLKHHTPAYILITLFLNHVVQAVHKKDERKYDDPVFQIFFEGNSVHRTEFSDINIPEQIHRWLEILSYGGKGFRPSISIEETAGDTFRLKLELRNHHTKPPGKVLLQRFLKEDEYQNDRRQALRILTLLSRKLPALKSLIRSGKNSITLSGEEIILFLHHVRSVMMLTQAHVNLPRSLQKIHRPKASLRITTRKNAEPHGLESLRELLRFEWKISLAGRLVNVDYFKKLVRSKNLIKVRNSYVLLDKGDAERALKHIERSGTPKSSQLLRYSIAKEIEGEKIQLAPGAQRLIDQLMQKKRVALPGNFAGKLRPYQKRGFEWLYKNAQLGLGSILADDMGLGKTAEVLAFIQKAKDAGWLKDGPALVAAPATMLTNWVRECEKFTPQLKASIYHGSERSLSLGDIDIIITTLGIIRTDQNELRAIRWPVFIVDEAQLIKNFSAAQTKAVFSIPAGIKIAMSGTPVENRLMEYYSISQFVNPGYLGSANEFQREYVTPIEKYRDQSRMELFKKITSPFLLRRLKTDKKIIKDLPEKIVINRYVIPTEEQMELYESVSRKSLKKIERARSAVTRNGLVLKMILQLKQICNHPLNFMKTDDLEGAQTGKSEALKEIISRVTEANSKALIFTQFREMGEILIEMIKDFGEDALFFHGGLTGRKRDEIVRTFQNDHWPRVLILSTKAGGTGLNLTAATHVIHYDLWWNPAVENQATDRAFRIGQHQKVTVYRLISINTLEENIDRMMEEKKELQELTVATGERWIGDLSTVELKKLIGIKDQN